MQAAALEAVLDTLSEGYLFYNDDGKIARLNSVAAELLSCSPADYDKLLQEVLASLVIETPDGRPLKSEETPWLRALHGEAVRGMKLLIHCPSHNKHLWVSMSAAPVRTSDGKIQGAVALLTDISVRPTG
jgi:PAS domain-containing protein